MVGGGVPISSYWHPLGVPISSYWHPLGVPISPYWHPLGGANKAFLATNVSGHWTTPSARWSFLEVSKCLANSFTCHGITFMYISPWGLGSYCCNMFLSDLGISGLQFMGLSVCPSIMNATLLRLKWFDSGWWSYQLNTNWWCQKGIIWKFDQI